MANVVAMVGEVLPARQLALQSLIDNDIGIIMSMQNQR